jgi:hypothetical protein
MSKVLKRDRRARYRLKGVSAGVTDATNLTIIVRWCAENNGSFTLCKEGGRGKGRKGPSRWRVILLGAPEPESLGRRGERVLFNAAHADISVAVARAARSLENGELVVVGG